MAVMPMSMAKGLKKSPQYNTVVQRPAAGRGVSSTSLMPYPCWTFEWSLDSIQGNEALASSVLTSFLGTFMVCNGQGGFFLFTDPQDNTVSLANSAMLNVTANAASPMGLKGDGVSTQFQLARTIGGIGYDIIQNVNGIPNIHINGTPTAAYTMSITGVVTFTSAPANNAVLTWQGSFYFLCRFIEDSVNASRTFTTSSGTDTWDVNGVRFASELV
jgi:uncharacterized protein (TIGR02217 family)